MQKPSNQSISLREFEGKVLLIVNVASHCGFTSQYQGLEILAQRYRQQGFEILGFPCNQFGNQEPGTDHEIQQFCSMRFHVTFPIFSKIEVKGPHQAPLFEYLTETLPGLLGTKSIKWNFTKFLINQKGQPIRRYAPFQKPHLLEKDIEHTLSIQH